MPPRSIAAILRDAAALLSASPTARLDAEVLLAHVLRLERSRLLASGRDAPSARHRAAFARLLVRRADGEPVAYLTGKAWFYGLAFRVTPAVLVPRPETEMLVDWALARLARIDRQARVLDVGTGSGAVAVAIAANAPEADVHASELSPAALRVARTNATALLGSGVVSFHRADLLPRRPVRYDVVVSNPPYVAEEEPDAIDPNVAAYEPPLALYGGSDGLDVIRRLLDVLPERVADDGAVAFEIGWRHGARAAALARAAFPNAGVGVLPDLAGHDRLVVVDRAVPPGLLP